MNWQYLRDVAFRIGLYRGVKINAPQGLIICSLYYQSTLTRVFNTTINHEHPLAFWLLEECEGPWTVCMHRPLYRRAAYLKFARLTDAMTFRILAA